MRRNRFSDRTAQAAAKRRWFLVLCLMLAGCAAFAGRLGAFDEMPEAPLTWQQGAAAADLDGDGRPDLATVAPQGWGPAGFAYAIKINLTGQSASTFISFSNERDGIQIIPRDVDGDRDLDLVIVSGWARAPLGVWINDGRGRFRQGDTSAYPLFIWMDYPWLLRQPANSFDQAAAAVSFGTWMDRARTPACWNQTAKTGPQLVCSAHPRHTLFQARATRAPPSFLSF